MSFVEKLRLSLQLTRRLPVLTVTAMMVALAVVLNTFTLEVSESLKIGFSGLPVAVVGMLFGPVTGSFAGLAADLLKYIFKPTGGYFPGFTFNAMLTGFLYGVFLFKTKVGLGRIVLCRVTITVLINVILNTLWLYCLLGPAMLASLPLRIIKNAVMLPIDLVILWALVRGLGRIQSRLPKSIRA